MDKIQDRDELVPDKVVRAELGDITPMCLWRWEHDPDLNFPPPIQMPPREHDVEAVPNTELFRRLARTIRA